jgi:hypothetical protein
MMRILPHRRLNAFAEADAEVRLSTIFRVKRTEVGPAAPDRFPTPPSHFLLFRLPEPFRHPRPEGQKNIQTP